MKKEKVRFFFAHIHFFVSLQRNYEPRSKGRNFLQLWQMKNNSSLTN